MPRAWPPYRTARALLHVHVGRPAVVMGGGPSLPGAIAACPPDAVYLSVNDHGARLFKDRPKLARVVSYIVGADRIEERLRFDNGPRELKGQRDGKPWGIPLIGRHMWADYRLTFMVAQNSGIAAAWIARVMGCSPIIMVGMDLYCGGTYYDAPKAESTGHLLVDGLHIRRWATLSKQFPAMYRSIGCNPLLTAMCAHYDPNEPVDRPVRTDEILAGIKSAFVRLNKETLVSHRPFKGGEVLELVTGEADDLVKRQIAVRTAAPKGGA